MLALSACASLVTPSTLPELEESLPSPEIATPSSNEGEEAELATQALPPTDSHEPTTVAPQASIPNPDEYTWVQIAEGFAQPLLLANAGDGTGRLFIVGQQGMIWIIAEGEVLEEPFLEIRGRVGSQSSEQGLLGLAFHPNYAQNGYFYVDYTDVSGDTVVSRFQVSADPNRADPNTESILLQVDQPFANHNGGHIEFGPDGRLYISLGDGGSAGDPGGNGQSPDSLLGSLLRIDVDSESPYGIPVDNPFVKGGGRSEVWAYGLRNPWRFSFDSLTGDLYIADVGQNKWEEIDFLPAGSAGGANFGWNYFESNHAYDGNPPDGLEMIAPVAEYDHSNGRCSVTGGQVYRGENLTAWQGVYLYADFCSGEIFALLQDDAAQWHSEVVFYLAELISSFGSDEQGEIYLLDLDGGLFTLRELQ